MLNSSQSRVAKMECGDPSVSIDLLVRSLFIMGSSTMDLAMTIAEKQNSSAGSGALSGKRIIVDH